MPHRPERPSALTVYYDAACGFCVWSVAQLLRLDRARRVTPVAIQDARGTDLAGIPDDRVMASFHARIDGAAPVSAGAALIVLLSTVTLLRPFGVAAAAVPGLTDHAYFWVADRRGRWARFLPESAKRRARTLVAARATR